MEDEIIVPASELGENADEVLARYRELHPEDTGARVVRHGEEGYPGSDTRWDEEARAYVALSPAEIGAKRAAEAEVANYPGGLRSFINGPTLGLAGEMAGGVAAIGTGIRNFGANIGIGEGVPYNMGQAYRAMSEAERAAEQDFAARRPVTDIALRSAGAAALPGAGWVGASRNALQGAARAGAMNAGYGALEGFGQGQGGVLQRLPNALQGAAIGAGAGQVLRSSGNALARSGAQAADNAVTAASPQRLLSREGVDLTLGQMLEPTPVIGPSIRQTEDLLTGIPIAGSFVQGARRHGQETLNTAEINRGLAPIGESLTQPSLARRMMGETPAGYAAIEEAQARLGAAYDEVLPRVSAVFDEQAETGLQEVMTEAQSMLRPEQVEQLSNILRSRLSRLADENGNITGEAFKAAESELGQLSRQFGRNPDSAMLAQSIDDAREVVRDIIARQNPDLAPRIQDINRGYASLVRAEEAASGAMAQGRNGVFSPGELARSVNRTGGSRSTRSRGGALDQDLSAAAMQVLPSNIGDSGSAGRATLSAVMAGGAAGVVPAELAIPVIAVSIPYSAPAQRLLNAIYRSTDNPGAARRALGRLGALASQSPALQPFYDQAREALQAAGRQETPAGQQQAIRQQ